MKNIYDILQSYPVITHTIKNTSKLNFINTHIQQIFVINLKKDTLRRNYMITIMKKYKLNFTLVIVDNINAYAYQLLAKDKHITKNELGCLLSHLWCLQHIIRHKYKNAIILEDDVIFHKNFLELFSKIFNMNYDFLLLGACDFSFSKKNSKNVKNGLYRISPNAEKVYGAHANYYSLEGAKMMFKIKTTMIDFFDKDYSLLFSYFPDTSFICYPHLIVSDISTSNLEHHYPFGSVVETNYYNKCFVNFLFTDYHFIYLDILAKNKDYPIEREDTFKTYMSKLIYHYFYNDKLTQEIKERINMNFFTIEDIKNIISNT